MVLTRWLSANGHWYLVARLYPGDVENADYVTTVDGTGEEDVPEINEPSPILAGLIENLLRDESGRPEAQIMRSHCGCPCVMLA